MVMGNLRTRKELDGAAGAGSGDEGGRGPVRNKILRLSDGTLLAPASIEQGEWRCLWTAREDEGETWTRTADIRLPEPAGERSNLRRNSAVALGGRSGRSCAAAHLRRDYLYRTRTPAEDLGRSWSQPASSGIN